MRASLSTVATDGSRRALAGNVIAIADSGSEQRKQCESGGSFVDSCFASCLTFGSGSRQQHFGGLPPASEVTARPRPPSNAAKSRISRGDHVSGPPVRSDDMRAKGINYDTGFTPGGQSSRPVFDRRGRYAPELRVIADDLHATPCGSPAATPSGWRSPRACRRRGPGGLVLPVPVRAARRQRCRCSPDCARLADQPRRWGADGLRHRLRAEPVHRRFLPGRQSRQDRHPGQPGRPGGTGPAGRRRARSSWTSLAAGAAATVRERFRGKSPTPPEHGTDRLDALRHRERWTPTASTRGRLPPGRSLGIFPARQAAGGHRVRLLHLPGRSRGGGIGWVDVVDHDSRSAPHQRRLTSATRANRPLPARDARRLRRGEGVDTAFWFTFAGYGTRTTRPALRPRHGLLRGMQARCPTAASPPSAPSTPWPRHTNEARTSRWATRHRKMVGRDDFRLLASATP